MATLFFNSRIFSSSWVDQDFHAIYEEKVMVADWLEILSVLAESQGQFELIPIDAAKAIAKTCRTIVPDDNFLAEVGDGFESSGHSTQGLIRAVSKRCPKDAGDWFYYGATVQDLTDSWMSITNLRAHALLQKRVDKIYKTLLQLAGRYKNTPMAGRTHGQQGLPITFGFKVAGWSAEMARHITRLSEISKRLGFGQLSGGVGSMASLGPSAFKIQDLFFKKLGLIPAPISWTSSRDVFAEWSSLMVLICGTADRIGHEIYNLQRSEIDEVKEGFIAGTIGSITMPHKRNPEISEQLGTLSRMVRHNSNLICEGLVHDHERDGRSWKAEWNALPQALMAAGKALSLLTTLVENIEVNEDKMLSNLEMTKGFVLSEPLMLTLANKVGRKKAHEIVYEVSMNSHKTDSSFKETVLCDGVITSLLTQLEIENIFNYSKHTGHCAEMVKRMLDIGERYDKK